MYGEITALTNMNGFCFATNKYFASLYQVTVNTIQKWLDQLESCGYIVREFIEKMGQSERRIKLVLCGVKENTTSHEKSFKGHIKNYTQNNTLTESNIIIHAREEKKGLSEDLNQGINEAGDLVEESASGDDEITIAEGEFYLDTSVEVFKDATEGMSDDDVGRCAEWIMTHLYGQKKTVNELKKIIARFKPAIPSKKPEAKPVDDAMARLARMAEVTKQRLAEEARRKFGSFSLSMG